MQSYIFFSFFLSNKKKKRCANLLMLVKLNENAASQRSNEEISPTKNEHTQKCKLDVAISFQIVTIYYYKWKTSARCWGLHRLSARVSLAAGPPLMNRPWWLRHFFLWLFNFRPDVLRGLCILCADRINGGHEWSVYTQTNLIAIRMRSVLRIFQMNQNNHNVPRAASFLSHCLNSIIHFNSNNNNVCTHLFTLINCSVNFLFARY